MIGGEVVKCLISGGLVLRQEGTLAYIFHDTQQLLRSSVPALLYLVQNNLQYLAVSHLHPATYHVTYQLKILSTALLSVYTRPSTELLAQSLPSQVLMLGRKLSFDKWVALIMLTFGVVLIVVCTLTSTLSLLADVTVLQLSEMSSSPTKQQSNGSINLPVGIFCTLISTLSSGCAGIYFELMLKGAPYLASPLHPHTTAPITLWLHRKEQSERGPAALCMGAEPSTRGVLCGDWFDGTVREW